MASVEGRSMQPTINPTVEGKNLHEWVLVSKLGAKRYEYSRGDVVMLKYRHFVVFSHLAGPRPIRSDIWSNALSRSPETGFSSKETNW